jgi:hypothetical protein
MPGIVHALERGVFGARDGNPNTAVGEARVFQDLADAREPEGALGVAAPRVVRLEDGIEDEPDASQCARKETSRPEKPFVIGTPGGILTL